LANSVALLCWDEADDDDDDDVVSFLKSLWNRSRDEIFTFGNRRRNKTLLPFVVFRIGASVSRRTEGISPNEPTEFTSLFYRSVVATNGKQKSEYARPRDWKNLIEDNFRRPAEGKERTNYKLRIVIVFHDTVRAGRGLFSRGERRH